MSGPPPPDPRGALGPGRQARARAAVLELARTETRRRHPVLVHVGDPRGRVSVVAAELCPDHALRTDVLGALVWRHRDEDPLVWLTRTGPLEWQDVDARWFAAFGSARREVLVGAEMLVVTRHGWLEPVSGATRTWKRIRDRRQGSPDR